MANYIHKVGVIFHATDRMSRHVEKIGKGFLVADKHVKNLEKSHLRHSKALEKFIRDEGKFTKFQIDNMNKLSKMQTAITNKSIALRNTELKHQEAISAKKRTLVTTEIAHIQKLSDVTRKAEADMAASRQKGLDAYASAYDKHAKKMADIERKLANTRRTRADMTAAGHTRLTAAGRTTQAQRITEARGRFMQARAARDAALANLPASDVMGRAQAMNQFGRAEGAYKKEVAEARQLLAAHNKLRDLHNEELRLLDQQRQLTNRHRQEARQLWQERKAHIADIRNKTAALEAAEREGHADRMHALRREIREKEAAFDREHQQRRALLQQQQDAYDVTKRNLNDEIDMRRTALDLQKAGVDEEKRRAEMMDKEMKRRERTQRLTGTMGAGGFVAGLGLAAGGIGLMTGHHLVMEHAKRERDIKRFMGMGMRGGELQGVVGTVDTVAKRHHMSFEDVSGLARILHAAGGGPEGITDHGGFALDKVARFKVGLANTHNLTDIQADQIVMAAEAATPAVRFVNGKEHAMSHGERVTTFVEYLDAMTQLFNSFGGKFRPNELMQQIRMLKGTKFSMTTEGIARSVILGQELGGAKTGTAYSSWVQGLLYSKQLQGANQGLADLGIVNAKHPSVKMGKKGIESYGLGALKGWELASQDPTLWIKDVLGPAIRDKILKEHKGEQITDTQMRGYIGKEVSNIGGRANVRDVIQTIMMQWPRLEAELNRGLGTLGPDGKRHGGASKIDRTEADSRNLYGRDVSALTVEFERLQQVLGGVLKEKVQALIKDTTQFVVNLTSWIEKNPKLIQLMWDAAGVAVKLAVGLGAIAAAIAGTLLVITQWPVALAIAVGGALMLFKDQVIGAFVSLGSHIASFISKLANPANWVRPSGYNPVTGAMPGIAPGTGMLAPGHIPAAGAVPQGYNNDHTSGNVVPNASGGGTKHSVNISVTSDGKPMSARAASVASSELRRTVAGMSRVISPGTAPSFA